MPIDVLMPQLSPTMTEGRLANWLKAEGDSISAGDVIAEVETDKATMEVEAAEDGILHKIFEQPGKDIQVGAPIAVLKEEGEDVPADYQPQGQNQPAAEPAPDTPTEPTPEETPATAAPAQPQANLAPQPAKPAINTQASASSTPATPAPRASADGHIAASPLARRMAATKGVNLAGLQGSGPKGRIVARDVEKARPGIGAGAAQTIQRQTDAVEKLSPMRKAIAQRLTASKQHVPHFYLNTQVHMDSLLDTRQQVNNLLKEQQTDGKVSVNDCIIKACALALAQYPAANAAWNEDSVVLFGNVDVSVAVAIDGGLITPIVQNADQKSLVSISQEVKQLAKDARSGKLKPEQYEGGSFSLSNLGMYGVDSFSAIINPPQAAILACGKSVPTPVADEQGHMAVAQVMTMTLSVDHRVIDGALGAELLAAIKQNLEQPARLLV